MSKVCLFPESLDSIFFSIFMPSTDRICTILKWKIILLDTDKEFSYNNCFRKMKNETKRNKNAAKGSYVSIQTAMLLLVLL